MRLTQSQPLGVLEQIIVGFVKNGILKELRRRHFGHQDSQEPRELRQSGARHLILVLVVGQGAAEELETLL
jgi:hypothetical protein